MHEAKDLPAAIAAYTEAIRLDPQLCARVRRADRSRLPLRAEEADTAAAAREGYDKAQADARQALALAPDLAQAHLAFAIISESGSLDFTQASAAYDRALSLAPGNAEILRYSGLFAALMGHFDAGIAAIRRAVVLDPLCSRSRSRSAQRCIRPGDMRRRLRLSQKSSVLTLTTSGTYGRAGSPITGWGSTERARVMRD